MAEQSVRQSDSQRGRISLADAGQRAGDVLCDTDPECELLGALMHTGEVGQVDDDSAM